MVNRNCLLFSQGRKPFFLEKKMQVKKKKKEKGLRERVEEEEKCEGK